jgi:hypothetical protein
MGLAWPPEIGKTSVVYIEVTSNSFVCTQTSAETSFVTIFVCCMLNFVCVEGRIASPQIGFKVNKNIDWVSTPGCFPTWLVRMPTPRKLFRKPGLFVDLSTFELTPIHAFRVVFRGERLRSEVSVQAYFPALPASLLQPILRHGGGCRDTIFQSILKVLPHKEDI